MNKIYIPEGYKSALNHYESQRAIEFIKHRFQKKLAAALNLKRVSAPLFVDSESGLNDNLNGFERPVTFDIPATESVGEVVHSLAKWKRLALKRYDFYVGKGLYTDMNAIRRDEDLDNIHSIYVDQWDWEKVILKTDRTMEYLINTADAIVGAICDTNTELRAEFPKLSTEICRNMKVVSTQELEDMYPQLSAKERENAVAKEYKTVLITQIGDKLRSGKAHDGRAPDYDDWALNGDIVFYNEVLGRAFEISSMGIRVSPESLAEQLKKAGCEDRRELPFHKMLLDGKLPYTIGGGIGQSRLCMLMMGTAHIGEVQSSLWDKETVEACEKSGIVLL